MDNPVLVEGKKGKVHFFPKEANIHQVSIYEQPTLRNGNCLKNWTNMSQTEFIANCLFALQIYLVMKISVLLVPEKSRMTWLRQEIYHTLLDV